MPKSGNSPAHCARQDWRVSDPAAALAALQPVLGAMPRTDVVEQSDGYLHATSRSAFFGFVDDLELYADQAHGLLQARTRHAVVVLGFTARDPEGFHAQVNELFDLMKAGKIDPLVSETFPLARAGDAIAKLEAREAVGKLVVTME